MGRLFPITGGNFLKARWVGVIFLKVTCCQAVFGLSGCVGGDFFRWGEMFILPFFGIITCRHYFRSALIPVAKVPVGFCSGGFFTAYPQRPPQQPKYVFSFFRKYQSLHFTFRYCMETMCACLYAH